jgi:hypothetical protein
MKKRKTGNAVVLFKPERVVASSTMMVYHHILKLIRLSASFVYDIAQYVRVFTADITMDGLIT